jgi:ribose transport system permease protein
MVNGQPKHLALLFRRVPVANPRRIVSETSTLQVLALLGLFTVAATTIAGFLTKPSLYSTLVLASFLGLAAAGQTIVILIGGIDLSVPSLISAANLVAILLSGKGWNFGLVILFVLAACALIGGLNGYTVHRLRVSPLIVTLASGAMVSGAALGWTKSGFVNGNVPSWLSQFSSPIGRTFGIGVPPVVVLWAVVALVLGTVLSRTVTGRRIYATGANERAAELAGVATPRIWIGAFALSGLSAGVVGVLLTGFIGSAQVGIGDQYLFLSLTAVVVGGTSLVGARGDYWRTVLGALILTLITTLLVGHGAGLAAQEMLFGALILLFVGLYGRERRVRDRV